MINNAANTGEAEVPTHEQIHRSLSNLNDGLIRFERLIDRFEEGHQTLVKETDKVETKTNIPSLINIYRSTSTTINDYNKRLHTLLDQLDTLFR